MATREHFSDPLPKGLTILIGVEGDHEVDEVEMWLDLLTAWMMTHPGMPLLPKIIAEDCLVSPPERGNRHFEVRWIQV